MRALFMTLWKGWKEIAVSIGDFQARLILTVFYFTIALPAGALLSLTRDSLQLRSRSDRSGWVARLIEEPGLCSARRQF